MKKNSFSELTNEEVLSKLNFTKQVLRAFVLLYFAAILILLFLFFNRNFGDLSIALFVPLFVVPVALMPLYINYKMLVAEKTSRKL